MNIIEKIKEKFKEIFGKTGKKVALGATIATVGLATACSTDKEAKITDNPVKIEQDKNFREQYKHVAETKNEEKTVKQKINELKSPEDIESFFKNMYIEQRVAITGNTDYTTEDIKLDKQYLDTVYVNKKTGEMIPYGSNYKQVEQKLKEEGISYEIEEDVEIYKVTDTEGKVIDCVALKSKDGETVPVKVMMVEQFGKPYTSVLTTMGTAITAGVTYKGYVEKGNERDIEVSKKYVIQAVEKFENAKQNQNATEQKTEENPEEGLEHE